MPTPPACRVKFAKFNMRVSPAPAAVQLHEAPNEHPAPAAALASGAPSSTPPEKERVDGEQPGSATAAPRGRPKLPPIATAAAASPAGRMSAAVAAGIPPTPVKGPAVMAPPALVASASIQPQRVGSVSMRVKPSSDATASQGIAASPLLQALFNVHALVLTLHARSRFRRQGEEPHHGGNHAL